MKTNEILDDRYELVRTIGVGGMGSVWEATQISTGRRVAIKALHEHLLDNTEMMARFLREAHAALEARFSAHIIEVIDVVQPPGRVPYLVMEHLEGRDLGQLLKDEGPLEPRRAANLIIQACHAVAEVHRLGMIHRDVKPTNLFVTTLDDGSEWIKLLDFGVAKLSSGADTEKGNLTAAGFTVGTPFYMAPEQLLARKQVDHRADIYSMGVVLYEILTGRKPYLAKDLASLTMQVAKGQVPPPGQLRPDLPPGLEGVITRAMSISLENRYNTMFDLAEALEPFIGNTGDAPPADDPTECVEKPASRESYRPPPPPALFANKADPPEEAAQELGSEPESLPHIALPKPTFLLTEGDDEPNPEEDLKTIETSAQEFLFGDGNEIGDSPPDDASHEEGLTRTALRDSEEDPPQPQLDTDESDEELSQTSVRSVGTSPAPPHAGEDRDLTQTTRRSPDVPPFHPPPSSTTTRR